MPKPQTAASHTAFDPAFHFIAIPLLIVNLGVAITFAVHHWHHNPWLRAWAIVMALVLIVIVSIARNSAIRAQNRIIRLEERLRLILLLPAADHPLIPRLTTRQLIALRFASDTELPNLVHKTLAENLDLKAIKQAIVTWRPDYERV